MINKTRKILTIVALSTMGLAVAMLIGGIFGLKVFEGLLLKFMLSFAAIALASAFSITSLNVLKNQKIISYICLGLLGLSLLFALIVFWIGFKASVTFNRITSILAIATVLFCIIVSLNDKIQKRFMAIQIITYSVIALIDIVLTLLIVGVKVFKVSGLSAVFFAVCLVAFALLCTLSILGKKKDETVSEAFIKVKKVEYDALLEKVKLLEEENKRLKGGSQLK